MEVSKKNKGTKPYQVWIGLFVLIAIIFPLVYENQTSTRRMSSGVTAIPVESTSKSYTLDALVETKTSFLPLFIRQEKFNVVSVTWPNGGEVTTSCDPDVFTEMDQRTRCRIGDDEYYIELNEKAL